MAGYRPSTLTTSARLAAGWEAAAAAVKLETDRWGLPSFKVVGTSWATVRALADHLPDDWAADQGLSGLEGRLPDDLVLAAATEGNHGEALAYIARLLGLRCRIFVSADVAPSTRARIAAHGAELVAVPGSYDDAVAASANAADTRTVVISDTSWDGYEEIPRAVGEGYSTILAEADEQLASQDIGPPDLVLVPIGVGALASAVIRHYQAARSDGPAIVGVEPAAAACVMSLPRRRRAARPARPVPFRVESG